MSELMCLIRAPKVIQNRLTGETLKLHGLELGEEPKAIYEDRHGSTILMEPKRVETEFVYERETPSNLVTQGKFECAAAGLAILMGHTLFMVKTVMGGYGWRNDRSGASDKILRETARAFGHDLLLCGRRSMVAILHKMPPCLLTIPSLNYPKAAHGVAWYEGQIVDPNHGRAGRMVWGKDWAPWTINAHSALVLTKRPLTDRMHKEFKLIRDKAGADEVCDALLSLA